MRSSVLFIVLLSIGLSACNSGGSGQSGGATPQGGTSPQSGLSQWQSSSMGQEGHGGDAIVCFSIPVDQALSKVGNEQNSECTTRNENEFCAIESGPQKPGQGSGVAWKMTEAGRKSIRSAKPLEQYLAEKISSKKLILDQLNTMPLQAGYEKMLSSMQNFPAPFQRLVEIHNKLGWLHEDGISSEFGLIDINDSGFLSEQEIDRVYCKELQAVVRRDTQLWYDADIVSHFDNAGRIMIQLHEEIYTWGKQQDEINRAVLSIPAHETSTKTRRLILKLIDENLSPKVIGENLKSLGFSILYSQNYSNAPISTGYFMDTQTCLQEQQYLKKHFQIHGSDWLKVESLFSSRYLKSDFSWAVVELRHNFPDVLSQMISLVMRADGERLMDEVLQLQKEFENPESCHGQFL